MKGFLDKYKYHFLIVLVAVVGYWQVAFMRYTLKWDMLDYFFPWRYLISECLHNGAWPFWNPYQNWGYAMHADPQGGVWYPMVWVISLLHGYDVYALQFEFMLHVVLAGIGMYLLIDRFVKDRLAAFLVACTYMLSGFFVGHSQHLSNLASATWIPYVLLYYSKMYEKADLRNAVQCSLSFFMLTTGGYPSHPIILAYALVIISLWKIVKEWRQGNKKEIKKFLLFCGGAMFLLILLCSGTIFSTLISKDYITRTSKLTLTQANYFPFSPQALISLLFPLASAKNQELFETDPSMSNMYMGIFMLAVFILALFRKKSRFEKIVLFTGLFFLLVAFGRYTPARALLYYAVPLMNLFRFPSLFRLFALICFMIVAGFSLRDLLRGENARQYKFIVFGLAIIYLITAAIYFSVLRLPDLSDLSFFVRTLTFKESFALQALIGLIIIICFLIPARKNLKASLITAFILVELFVSAQLNIPITTTGEIKTTIINRQLKRTPKGFPVPENLPAINYKENSTYISALYRNTSTFTKQPGYDGFNSFKMKGYGRIEQDTLLLNAVLQNKVAFLSGSFSFYDDTIKDVELIQKNPSHLFFLKSDESKVNKMVANDSIGTVVFTRFEPGNITISATTSSPQYLTLMQHNYPLWQVKVDDQIVQAISSDYLFMSVLVPQGKHQVEFLFHNRSLKVVMIISVVSLLSCLIFLVLRRTKNASQNI